MVHTVQDPQRPQGPPPASPTAPSVAETVTGQAVPILAETLKLYKLRTQLAQETAKQIQAQHDVAKSGLEVHLQRTTAGAMQNAAASEKTRRQFELTQLQQQPGGEFLEDPDAPPTFGPPAAPGTAAGGGLEGQFQSLQEASRSDLLRTIGQERAANLPAYLESPVGNILSSTLGQPFNLVGAIFGNPDLGLDLLGSDPSPRDVANRLAFSQAQEIARLQPGLAAATGVLQTALPQQGQTTRAIAELEASRPTAAGAQLQGVTGEIEGAQLSLDTVLQLANVRLSEQRNQIAALGSLGGTALTAGEREAQAETGFVLTDLALDLAEAGTIEKDLLAAVSSGLPFDDKAAAAAGLPAGTLTEETAIHGALQGVRERLGLGTSAVLNQIDKALGEVAARRNTAAELGFEGRDTPGGQAAITMQQNLERMKRVVLARVRDEKTIAGEQQQTRQALLLRLDELVGTGEVAILPLSQSVNIKAMSDEQLQSFVGELEAFLKKNPNIARSDKLAFIRNLLRRERR